MKANTSTPTSYEHPASPTQGHALNAAYADLYAPQPQAAQWIIRCDRKLWKKADSYSEACRLARLGAAKEPDSLFTVHEGDAKDRAYSVRGMGWGAKPIIRGGV
jgi:hypothetical protein